MEKEELLKITLEDVLCLRW